MLRSAIINVLENAAEACAVEGGDKKRQVLFHIESNAEWWGSWWRTTASHDP